MGGRDTFRSAIGRARDATRRTIWIGAGSSFLVQLALTAGYSLLVIASLKAPSSGLAHLMAQWDLRVRPALNPLFDALGAPPCAAPSPRAVQLYQAYIQLIIADLILAAGCFLACSPAWGGWGKTLRSRPRWAQAPPATIENEFEYGEALTLAGALGVLWFLAAAPYPAINCSTLDLWLFLRPPMAISAAYGLGCFAAAFGSARASSDDDEARV
jgi:hypothetical protein